MVVVAQLRWKYIPPSIDLEKKRTKRSGGLTSSAGRASNPAAKSEAVVSGPCPTFSSFDEKTNGKFNSFRQCTHVINIREKFLAATVTIYRM